MFRTEILTGLRLEFVGFFAGGEGGVECRVEKGAGRSSELQRPGEPSTRSYLLSSPTPNL